jgi:hypothetical protein
MEADGWMMEEGWGLARRREVEEVVKTKHKAFRVDTVGG